MLKNRKLICAVVIAAALATLLVCGTAQLLIRNLDAIGGALAPSLGLGKSDTASVVEALSALRDAEIRFPLAIFLVCLPCCALLALLRVPKKRPARIAVTAAIGVLLYPIVTCVCLCFTDVNQIRVGDVLLSLLQIL